MKHTVIFLVALAAGIPAATAFSQALQDRAASQPVEEQILRISPTLPKALLAPAEKGMVHLSSGLFHERRELAKAYDLRLKTENLLQNHMLEAGMRVDTPLDQMHLGWESPNCQLRGHFVGHWISSMAHFAADDNDPVARQRVIGAVDELKQCQDFNGDGWVGSIPEKFFTILEDNNRWVWSPQYTLHKTMMGLYDAYVFTGDKEALEVDARSADWFLRWTDELISKGRSDVIYRGECAGMLELWANLYGATGDKNYLTLASRYAMPDIFRGLLDGKDPLSNIHTNASIPWIQGAARLYEVTGDVRYRKIVEAFWKDAVTDRGMFATTGNNAGEFWIPKQQFGRFLGNRTQEHCTVYNMIRVAQYLFRWTGESVYADYIERALYNGILAQQNPNTGMVAYFLPLCPGAKKTWGSETHDFWCCDGTMIQAQAMYEDLIYFTTGDGLSVVQFIPSVATLKSGEETVKIEQKVNWNNAPADFENTDGVTHMKLDLEISTDGDKPLTLRIRQPEWALETGTVTVNGAPVQATVSASGFIEITQEWKSAHVTVTFPKQITRESLPGDDSRFALLDGPVVLAALCDEEPALVRDTPLVPQYEHVYENGRDWQAAHYLAHTNQGTVRLEPLYEVADETYSVYFTESR